jgi:hypothetical protein
MRKVFVKVEVNLVINADEGVDIDDVLAEMDYDFHVCKETDGAEIIDSEITDWEITDSK